MVGEGIRISEQSVTALECLPQMSSTNRKLLHSASPATCIVCCKKIEGGRDTTQVDKKGEISSTGMLQSRCNQIFYLRTSFSDRLIAGCPPQTFSAQLESSICARFINSRGPVARDYRDHVSD